MWLQQKLIPLHLLTTALQHLLIYLTTGTWPQYYTLALNPLFIIWTQRFTYVLQFISQALTLLYIDHNVKNTSDWTSIGRYGEVMLHKARFLNIYIVYWK